MDVHAGGTGPYLLLVHGFLSSRAQWRLNLEGLKSSFRPVVVELWGHGRSPAPIDPEAYRASSYIDAFEAIRRGLGIDRWMICGQSFGAGLTIRYAHRHPDRVVGQVFTNSMSALSMPDQAQDAAIRLARADGIERGGHTAVEALPFHPRFALRISSNVRQEMLDDAALISPIAIANAIRYTAAELSTADFFRNLTVPTLLVNGLWEKKFQPLRNIAAKWLPALEVADIEGGHSINLEAPEHFNLAVTDFARRLE
ncbi:alpha/beta fold hydrolase [Bradyrhizobium sp. B097]|uniref:alpha/beta fold hydrolase n=1 Tax=Bradyrhizobium sp. B097 TaxID=3140244 RepID=UPI0031830554